MEIPTRRAEPLVLKAAAESYGDGWFAAFELETNPKSILAAVREFVGAGKFKDLDEAGRKKIADRLAFALKGARKVDDALYARLAACLAELKLDDAVAAKARTYLWTDARYLAAARDLPASEMPRLVSFLVAENEEEAKQKLFAALPQMCFPLLTATLEHYRDDAACEAAVAELLKSPHAPATLVVLVLGRYHVAKKTKAEGTPGEVEAETGFKNWSKLPPLVVILTHAIAIGEGRQSGETLKMQNTVRRLFADQKWLKEIFDQLDPDAQVLFFERFQASTTWDPSTHHTIVVRMTHIVPKLAERQAKVVAAEPVARITSLRSYAERKAAYQKLINVDMPENAKRIEFARSYGDLSENAEYQYAKDEQRALMQKQTLMQEEIPHAEADAHAGGDRGRQAHRLRRCRGRPGSPRHDGHDHDRRRCREDVHRPRRMGQRPRAQHHREQDAPRAEHARQEAGRHVRAAGRRGQRVHGDHHVHRAAVGRDARMGAGPGRPEPVTISHLKRGRIS